MRRDTCDAMCAQLRGFRIDHNAMSRLSGPVLSTLRRECTDPQALDVILPVGIHWNRWIVHLTISFFYESASQARCVAGKMKEKWETDRMKP